MGVTVGLQTKYLVKESKLRRILTLIAMAIFISISGINCGSDEVTNPENNDSPTATITSPANGSSFTDGEMISFAGTGTDPEDGTLPEDSLLWTSDMDGQVGTGTSVSTSLSVNDHIITLTVTDSEGNIDADTITIYVTSGSGSSYDELISVPAGSYLMGWDEIIAGHEDPAHTVSLSAFRIGKYEVTYELWIDVKTYADANGYTINDGVWGDGSNSIPYEPVTDIHWKDCVAWCNAYSEKEGLTPVYYATSALINLYKDASALYAAGNIGSDCVKWSADGYRLPTEAEWECAARYIDGTTVSPGDKHSGYNLNINIVDCAWFRYSPILRSERVGLLQANSLGAYDMSGNVYEWCWDRYDEDYYETSPISNPYGPESGDRIYRGGCYAWSSTDIYAYVAYRGATDSFTRHLCGGLRVCRSGSGN